MLTKDSNKIIELEWRCHVLVLTLYQAQAKHCSDMSFYPDSVLRDYILMSSFYRIWHLPGLRHVCQGYAAGQWQTQDPEPCRIIFIVCDLNQGNTLTLHTHADRYLPQGVIYCYPVAFTSRTNPILNICKGFNTCPISSSLYGIWVVLFKCLYFHNYLAFAIKLSAPCWNVHDLIVHWIFFFIPNKATKLGRIRLEFTCSKELSSNR